MSGKTQTVHLLQDELKGDVGPFHLAKYYSFIAPLVRSPLAVYGVAGLITRATRNMVRHPSDEAGVAADPCKIPAHEAEALHGNKKKQKAKPLGVRAMAPTSDQVDKDDE